MKKIKKVLIVIALFVSFLLVIPYKTVKADSGFDTDYDSGDSGWSDSSWDYDSDGYSSTDSDPVFVLIVFTIVVIIFIAIAISENKTKIKEEKENAARKEEEIKRFESLIDIKAFEKYAYNTFVSIQEAWMNFDYDKLRSLLTDELYNTYQMQLTTLKTKGEKNIMKDFKFEDFTLKDVVDSEKTQIVVVNLSVSFKDYIVNNEDKVVRGNKTKTYHMTYELTFIKTKDKKDNICPNCGKKLEQQASNRCPYCNSIVIADSYDYVMSRKVKISQR